MQVITSFVVLGLCFAAFIYTDIRGYKQRKIKSVTAIAQVTGTSSISSIKFLDNAAAAQLLSQLVVQDDISNASILDIDGKVFASYTRSGAFSYSFPKYLKGHKSFEFIGNNLFVYSDIIDNKLKIGTLCLKVELTQLDVIINDSIKIASILLLVGIALAFLISLSVQRFISRPLLKLVRVMQNIKESGNYTSRSDMVGNDEIGTLSSVFNDMLEQIEKRDNVLEFRVTERTSQLENSLLELKESEGRIQAIIENAPSAVVEINESGNVEIWNRKAESMFGIKAEEIIGKPMHDIIMPERYRQLHMNGLTRFLQTGEAPVFGKTLELSALRKNGNEFPIELSISSAMQQGRYVFIAFINDITESKKAEREIKQTNYFLDSILENIPNMIFVKEAKELRFVRFNKAGEKLLGYSREDLIGKNDYDFFDKEQADFFTSKDREVFKNQEVLDIAEEPIDTKNGKRWLHTKKLTVTDEQGAPVYLLGISEDITEKKKTEEQLVKRSEELEAANKELESFSYSVSHDMRAPLRAVSGFTKMLKEDYAQHLDERGKTLLTTIINEAVRMGQLIDDLLAFSRLGRQEVQKSKVDMNELAKEALDEVLKAAEVEVTPEIKLQHLPEASCDRSLIRQVFINLISNAVKYSGKNAKPEVQIGSFSENAKNVYFVKDNGVGFDMKYSNKLFGVFQRLHSQEEFKGTGIGLAIVQKIVTRHGGNAWAEAKLGEGAAFYFSLPQ